LAEEQLEAEESKFEVGLSTNFFVLQTGIEGRSLVAAPERRCGRGGGAAGASRTKTRCANPGVVL